MILAITKIANMGCIVRERIKAR